MLVRSNEVFAVPGISLALDRRHETVCFSSYLGRRSVGHPMPCQAAYADCFGRDNCYTQPLHPSLKLKRSLLLDSRKGAQNS
jgi:hypothetical protein